MPCRVKTYDVFFCIGDFKKSAVKVNKDEDEYKLEYERLNQNNLFSTIKRNSILIIRLQFWFIIFDHFQNIKMI